MLWAAYKQTQEQGSSTACILKLKHDQLHGTNVGDSGFMVVRGSDVSFQSPHQQHSFNFPFQLGRQEPQMASETPARAQVQSAAPSNSSVQNLLKASSHLLKETRYLLCTYPY